MQQGGGSTGTGRTGSAGRLIGSALALVVALVLVLSVVVLVRSVVPGVDDCTAEVGDRSVDLSRDDAEEAANLAARGVRRQAALRVTSARIAAALDLPADDARLVATVLTGRERAGFVCTHGGSDAEEEPDRLSAVGLTDRATRVRRDLDRAFGRQQVGGFAAGGVSSGHMPGSTHYEGRAVDVFFRPVNARNKTRGWAVAHYLVAHAERLAVNTVIFDGRIWTDRRSFQGWRSYDRDTSGRSREVAAVLLHRDHVHVDVAD